LIATLDKRKIHALEGGDKHARTLTAAREIARAVGLNFVYTGNAHDERGQSTYCPACGERVIGRDWYEITAWRLTEEGRCGNCGSAIPGLFAARPGRWGQRRMPVRVGGPGSGRRGPPSDEGGWQAGVMML